MLSIKLSENGGKAPEAVPYMPAGQHSICATVNGKPGRRVVNVDKAAYERLQADLAEHLRASAAGEKARPMLMFDTRRAMPLQSRWASSGTTNAAFYSAWNGLRRGAKPWRVATTATSLPRSDSLAVRARLWGLPGAWRLGRW